MLTINCSFVASSPFSEHLLNNENSLSITVFILATHLYYFAFGVDGGILTSALMDVSIFWTVSTERTGMIVPIETPRSLVSIAATVSVIGGGVISKSALVGAALLCVEWLEWVTCEA